MFQIEIVIEDLEHTRGRSGKMKTDFTDTNYTCLQKELKRAQNLQQD